MDPVNYHTKPISRPFQVRFQYFQMFKMACCGDDNNLEDDDGDADNDDEANDEDDDQSLSSLKRSPSKPGSR